MATPKSLEAALCQCRLALRNSRITQYSSRRAFASSASRRKPGNLPVLHESSVPELTSLFADIRSKIFIPGYLKASQAKLVFSGKNRAMLENDPFFVDIGDESIQLHPLDMTKDIPNSWASLKQAMELFGDDPTEWTNLLSLLEGFHLSGKKWSSLQWEIIARTAGDAGMAHILIEAVRRASRTGFVLHDTRIVREVMWACINKALLGGDGAASSIKAASYAANICDALEQDEHCGRPDQRAKDVMVRHGDPRRQPDIIGAQLYLTAQYADRYQDGIDAGDQVKKLTLRLVPNLTNDPHVSRTKKPERLPGKEAEYQLHRWSPVLKGLMLSEKILRSKLPSADIVRQSIADLEAKTKSWRETVTSARQADEDFVRPGARCYDALLAT